jgi:hypothetical protein
MTKLQRIMINTTNLLLHRLVRIFAQRCQHLSAVLNVEKLCLCLGMGKDTTHLRQHTVIEIFCLTNMFRTCSQSHVTRARHCWPSQFSYYDGEHFVVLNRPTVNVKYQFPVSPGSEALQYVCVCVCV